MSTYACSDIHGQYQLYKNMIEGIGLKEDDHLYILGDMIDRGPQSIEIIRDVMSRPNVTCLLGNHERMVHDHYRGRDRSLDCWLLDCNGGRVTKRAFTALTEEEQERILNHIDDMPLQIAVKEEGAEFLLSHSAYIEGEGTLMWRDVDDMAAFNAVWESPWRFWEYFDPERYLSDGRWHVVGHVPVQRIEVWPERAAAGAGDDLAVQPGRRPAMPAAYVDEAHRLVNIDLGCASYGTLRAYPGASLCCMNLTAFAAGDRDGAFLYFQ